MIRESKSTHHEFLLFEDSTRPVRFWLEELGPDQWVRRKDQTLWEELFFFEGMLSLNGRPLRDGYFCLPPGKPISSVKTAGGKASLLRMLHKDHSVLQSTSVNPIEPTPKGELVWNEIPARRQHDPGGRVAELFRNESGKQITSLMECRPGWVLEDHEHPSDVFPFCIRGGGRLSLGDRTISLIEKQLVLIPAGTRHRFETGQQGALFIIFVFESLAGRNT